MKWIDPSIKVEADLKGALSQAASLMYWMVNNPRVKIIMGELGLADEFKGHYTALVSSPLVAPAAPAMTLEAPALPPGEIPKEEEDKETK